MGCELCERAVNEFFERRGQGVNRNYRNDSCAQTESCT